MKIMIPKSVAKLIKKRIIDDDLNQSKLCALAGISKARLSAALLGKRFVTPEIFEIIIDHLNFSKQELEFIECALHEEAQSKTDAVKLFISGVIATK